MATPKLAPDEIPKTKGPASGFLNKVCINNPLTERPEPTKIAVIVLGSLYSKIMVFQLVFKGVSPNNVVSISDNGMATEPILIFSNPIKIKVIPKNINCLV